MQAQYDKPNLELLPNPQAKIPYKQPISIKEYFDWSKRNRRKREGFSRTWSGSNFRSAEGLREPLTDAIASTRDRADPPETARAACVGPRSRRWFGHLVPRNRDCWERSPRRRSLGGLGRWETSSRRSLSHSG